MQCYSLEKSAKFLNNQRYASDITNVIIGTNSITDEWIAVFKVRIVDRLSKKPNKIFGFSVDLDKLITVPITEQVLNHVTTNNGDFQLKAKYRKTAIQRLWKPIIKNTHVYSTKDRVMVSDL